MTAPASAAYETLRLSLGVDATLRSRRGTFSERIACWNDTRARAAAIATPPSVKTRCPPGLDTNNTGSLSERARARARARVTVENADSLDCGLAYLAAGMRPVVLNLADDCMPGGCVDIGSGAQEESLFRRTTLCETLRMNLYPIADDEGIYSPEVAVLKSSEADGWKLLSEPYSRIAFLTVPGVKYPRCTYDAADRDKPPRLFADDERRLEVKVRTMLRIAAANGHDCVVLGASGCGAWKCPPEHVAEVFARVVAEHEHAHAFDVIAFAVLKDADDNADAKRAMGIVDNHDVFSSVLLLLEAPIPPLP